MVSVSFFFFLALFDLHIFIIALSPFYLVSQLSLLWGKEPIKVAYKILHTWTKIAYMQRETDSYTDTVIK